MIRYRVDLATVPAEAVGVVSQYVVAAYGVQSIPQVVDRSVRSVEFLLPEDTDVELAVLYLDEGGRPLSLPFSQPIRTPPPCGLGPCPTTYTPGFVSVVAVSHEPESKKPNRNLRG